MLKKIFTFLLFLLLLAVVAAGLFLLAWWADWPLVSVVVLPLGLIALGLIVYAIWRVWRWKNRAAYVRTVLKEDPSRIEQTYGTVQETAFQRAWAKGLRHFGSNLPKQRAAAIYRNPWVLALGDSDSQIHALAATQAPALDLQEAGAPLYWHFLKDMVLLEPAANLLEGDVADAAWDNLLVELSRVRSKEPVNGFLVAVNAATLIAADNSPEGSESVRMLGLRLRARIDDILAVIPARTPLRVVVTGMEKCEGIGGLCARLSRQGAQQWLGHEFPPAAREELPRNHNQHAAALAIEQAAQRLRRILEEEAERGNLPDADDLYAPGSFAAMGNGLALFVDTLLRPSPNSNTPFLRGIHFAAVNLASGNTAASTGVFASEIFHDLAADRLLARVVKHATPRDIPLAAAYAGACILLLAMCAAFGATAIYNHSVLASLPASETTHKDVTPVALGEAMTMADAVRQIHAATRHWWVPSFGLDHLHDLLAKRKAVFARNMRDNIVPQFLAECREGAAKAQGTSFPYAALQHLLWMQEVTEKGGNDEKHPFPVEETPPSGSTFWTPAFGRLYLDFLDWSQPVDRQNVHELLAAAISDIVGHEEGKIFQHVITLVNENSPQWDVPISRFWHNVPRGSANFMAVPPAYTARGFDRVCTNMEILTRRTGRNYRDSAYWKVYLLDYAKIWEEFIAKADEAWAVQDDQSILQEMSARPGSNDNPYFRLMQTVVTELQPLRHEPDKPAWIEDFCLLRALVQINTMATKTANPLAEKKVPGMALILWNAATELAREDLDVVRNRLANTHDLSALVDAVKAIASYQGALEELYQTSRDVEGSLELAKIEYGGKEYGDPQATATGKAKKYLADIATVLGFDSHKGVVRVRRDGSKSGQVWDASPVSRVYGGSLRFLQYLVICNAAVALQGQWESEVLPQGALVSAPVAPDTFFGESGLVSQFMAKQAKPFLHRDVDAFKPRVANDTPFPFTEDFLAFLGKGQYAQAHPRHDDYKVDLKSSIPGVNADAKERIRYYELTLTCKSGPVTLRNNNYPAQGQFAYKPKECGAVGLDIVFPSISLHYGYEDFPAFLKDFSYGERQFTQQDFPDAAEKMEGVGIKDITVRILPQNANEIFEAFGEELALPERITGVW